MQLFTCIAAKYKEASNKVCYFFFSSYKTKYPNICLQRIQVSSTFGTKPSILPQIYNKFLRENETDRTCNIGLPRAPVYLLYSWKRNVEGSNLMDKGYIEGNFEVMLYLSVEFFFFFFFFFETKNTNGILKVIYKVM